MARQDWILAIGMGVCAGFVSGCTTAPVTRNVIDQAKPPTIAETPATPAAANSTALAVAPQSPYNPQPTPPVPAPLENAEPAKSAGAVQPAHYPATQPVDAPKPLPVLQEPVGPLPQVEPVVPAKTLEKSAVVNALCEILQDQPEEAFFELTKYDEATRELLLRLLPLVAQLSKKSLDKASTEELALVMEQLSRAEAALGPRAPLALDHMCYCKEEVKRFGNYQALPSDHPFRPGEVVEVYVELRNFSSKPAGQFYEIHLASSLEIRDSQGQVRWQLNVPDRGPSDRSQSPRHDHFISYRFCIPENLRRGLYTFHVRVTDVPTRRTVEGKLDLQVTTRPVPGP